MLNLADAAMGGAGAAPRDRPHHAPVVPAAEARGGAVRLHLAVGDRHRHLPGGGRVGRLAAGVAGGDSCASGCERSTSMRWPLVTIAAMLAIAFTTRYSGMDATLGLAFTRTGAVYPLFAALLGWLGVALTGSDTSSNAMFGSLQIVTATRLAESGVLPLDAGTGGDPAGGGQQHRRRDGQDDRRPEHRRRRRGDRAARAGRGDPAVRLLAQHRAGGAGRAAGAVPGVRLDGCDPVNPRASRSSSIVKPRRGGFAQRSADVAGPRTWYRHPGTGSVRAPLRKASASRLHE